MYDRILLPLDGSKIAEKKIDEAIKVAKLTKGTLILFRILELTPMLPRDKEAEYRLLREQAEEYLSEVRSRIEAEGVKVETVIKPGKAAVEICKYAERDDVALVILGTHGMGGIVNWAIGSVTDKVVRHSPKPVLVLRSAAGHRI